MVTSEKMMITTIGVVFGMSIVSQIVQGMTTPGAVSPIVPVAPVLPEPGLANLYGVVTDVDTGNAIEGVSISVDGYTTLSDVGGSYVFSDLNVSSYHIKAEKDGYETTEGDITLAEGNNELGIQMVLVVTLVPSALLIALQENLEELHVELLELGSDSGVFWMVPYYGLQSRTWETYNSIMAWMIEEAIVIGLISSSSDCYFENNHMYYNDGTLIV